jgi:RimJ/RimL family protein N-acetyltransferase
MVPQPWLTTDRLALRRFTAADLDWLVSLYSDAAVMEHMGGPQDSKTVAEILDERILDYYDQHPGLGIWTTLERQSRSPIGFHLLNHIRGETQIQVGFILARRAWGRGYGTEMAEAILRYGFTELALPRIHGITSLGNVASQRVLEKIGLERHGERSFPAYATYGPQAFFYRDANDWLRRRGR